jgi:hypothetical protein
MKIPTLDLQNTFLDINIPLSKTQSISAHVLRAFQARETLTRAYHPRSHALLISYAENVILQRLLRPLDTYLLYDNEMFAYGVNWASAISQNALLSPPPRNDIKFICTRGAASAAVAAPKPGLVPFIPEFALEAPAARSRECHPILGITYTPLA